MNTLKTNADFRAAYRGKRINSANLFMIVSKDKFPRLGIVASKKTGNAVQRHTLQRITRAAVRNIDLTSTVLVVFKEDSGRLVSKADIRAELDAALRKMA